MAACERCPVAGNCGACPVRRSMTIRGESGSGEVLVSFEKLLSLPELPSIIDPNRIDFGSARRESSEPPTIITSEKICSRCNKPASACSCSEPSKN